MKKDDTVVAKLKSSVVEITVNHVVNGVTRRSVTISELIDAVTAASVVEAVTGGSVTISELLGEVTAASVVDDVGKGFSTISITYHIARRHMAIFT